MVDVRGNEVVELQVKFDRDGLDSSAKRRPSKASSPMENSVANLLESIAPATASKHSAMGRSNSLDSGLTWAGPMCNVRAPLGLGSPETSKAA